MSAQADPSTGAITIYSILFVGPAAPSGWFTIGGTSSAAPILAGLLALINSSASCRANPRTAHGVGFASPLLYALASDPAAYQASFTNVTTGSNDVFNLDNSLVYPATRGYDLATGLGTPELTGQGGTAGLAYYLCHLAAGPGRPAVTGIHPAQLPVSGGTVTIDGAGFTASGKARVGSIQVGSWRIPSSAFMVTSRTSIRAKFPPAADTVPPHSPRPLDGAGPAAVTVTLAGGQSSPPGRKSTVQYVDRRRSAGIPSVTGILPNGGSEKAPTPVRILGVGFTKATKVRFGGVPAGRFKVLSSSEILVTPPRYSRSVRCAPSQPGRSPATNVCQVQVQVTGPGGTSATGPIRPPLEGAQPPLNIMQVAGPPPGCRCEVTPAPTEFDYAPAPTITSVSTTRARPGSLASEQGTSLITVTGTGFNLLTMDWADIGDPSQEVSMVETGFSYLSGTKMQLIAFGQNQSTEPAGFPFSVRTLAGQSRPRPVIYAGVPEVTKAVDTALGRNGAPDTGRSPITISGRGFGQAVGPIQFASAATAFVDSTQSFYTVRGDKTIVADTLQQQPDKVDVQVCSVSGCSLNPPADYFFFFPPGNPVADSVKPASGPAVGGTVVTVTGQNLGCVTGVSFGPVPARKFRNGKAFGFCGSTTEVIATAPPGAQGTVKVTVTTVESDLTGPVPAARPRSTPTTRDRRETGPLRPRAGGFGSRTV